MKMDGTVCQAGTAFSLLFAMAICQLIFIGDKTEQPLLFFSEIKTLQHVENELDACILEL
jgi:hypothetical protein